MGKHGKLAKTRSNPVAKRRLQVWHYSDRGQNYADNVQLADFLTSTKLKNWVALPIEPTNASSYGQYFPLEVDLIYLVTKPRFSDLFKPRSEQTHCNAVGDLIEVLDSTLPQEIKRFFRHKREEPHQLVLFPLDGSLTEAERFKHTHVRMLKSLRVTCFTATEKSPVEPRDVPAEICKFATSMFSSAIVGAEVAPFARDIIHNWTWGHSNLDTYRKLRERWEIAEKETGSMTNEDQKYLEQRIKSGWTNGERCMDVFIETTESLSELVSSVSSGKGIPPQLLYESMICTRNATILLSQYQNQALDLSRLMLELQEGKKGWTKKSINTVVLLTGVAAIALAYFTGGLSIIIGGSIIGSTAVGVGGNELLHYKVLEKHKDKIKDFNTTISELDKALGDVNLALTAKFCSQVLRIPLDADTMTPARRNKILASLGVDPQAMRDAKYSEQLVDDRIMRFCKVFEDFERQKRELKVATGMTERREREGELVGVS